MKKIILILSYLTITISLLAQNTHQKYEVQIRKADSLYRVQDYNNSAKAFSNAFKVSDSEIPVNHRYNAACSYALANSPDSAFANLNYIASFMNYSRY